MLTTRALYERKWRHFPELGKALSDKPLSVEWTGSSSISDNIFDQVVRLLEIYALVDEHDQHIERALSDPDNSVKEELFELSRRLALVADRFAEASHQVKERARRARL
jgi:hypothetical protein